MFDLIIDKVQHAPRHQAISMLISVSAQAAVAIAIVLATLLVVENPIPREAITMAFVAAPPPPPPPPPAPPPKVPEPERRAPQAAPASAAAPVEPPEGIEPEAPVADLDDEWEGVPGGIVGGVAGGLETLAPPPAPPPPSPPSPPEPRKPVRVGGEIKEPSLVHRVEPVYPPVAVMANIDGTVVLEAIVDRDGHVESVRVLRSVPLLNQAAIDAVRQWVYSPVLLNGKPERFILTVVLRFRLEGVAR